MAPNKSRQPMSREASAPHYWHLAEDSIGVAMTDLEYAILRVFEAFRRWQSECLTAVWVRGSPARRMFCFTSSA